MDQKVEFHFRRLGLSGATLVVIAIGTKVYGACAVKPLVALHAAALNASQDLSNRRRPIELNVLIEWGQEGLRRASSIVEGAGSSSPVTFPREAA
jgi:hypothetical protein